MLFLLFLCIETRVFSSFYISLNVFPVSWYVLVYQVLQLLEPEITGIQKNFK